MKRIGEATVDGNLDGVTWRLQGLLENAQNDARELSELRYLLARGAQINESFMNKFSEWTYPIMEVVQERHWDDDWIFQKVRLLCDASADVNVSDADGLTPLYTILYMNERLRGENEKKREIMEVRVIQLLQRYGAERAPTMVGVLCHHLRQGGPFANILVLLEIGVDKDEIEETTGHSAFMIALEMKRWDVVNLLMERGASQTELSVVL